MYIYIYILQQLGINSLLIFKTKKLETFKSLCGLDPKLNSCSLDMLQNDLILFTNLVNSIVIMQNQVRIFNVILAVTEIIKSNSTVIKNQFQTALATKPDMTVTTDCESFLLYLSFDTQYVFTNHFLPSQYHPSMQSSSAHNHSLHKNICTPIF